MDEVSLWKSFILLHLPVKYVQHHTSLKRLWRCMQVIKRHYSCNQAFAERLELARASYANFIFSSCQDEISTGLDSSTTFQIVRSLRDFVQLGSATAMIALLQPAPEVFVSPHCPLNKDSETSWSPFLDLTQNASDNTNSLSLTPLQGFLYIQPIAYFTCTHLSFSPCYKIFSAFSGHFFLCFTIYS